MSHNHSLYELDPGGGPDEFGDPRNSIAWAEAAERAHREYRIRTCPACAVEADLRQLIDARIIDYNGENNLTAELAVESILAKYDVTLRA